ncbi:MAG: hypothetical protein R3D99_02590 [Altererythrobacter sp.]
MAIHSIAARSRLGMQEKMDDIGRRVIRQFGLISIESFSKTSDTCFWDRSMTLASPWQPCWPMIIRSPVHLIQGTSMWRLHQTNTMRH